MARVTTYLNFMGQSEEAFTFYRDLFGGEFIGPILRIGDMAPMPGGPQLSEDDLRKVMHMEVSILDGHVLMATDLLESMGHELKIGNNTTINLEPDTREETERIFNALCEGGSDIAPLADMPWGAYWGCVLDRFGVRWMFNYSAS